MHKHIVSSTTYHWCTVLSTYQTHTCPPLHTHVVCPSMCSLLTCVQRPACHCLGSVMDVPFVAHADRDSGGAHSTVLSPRRWVRLLFRKKDVISLVKNPTYVVCHSWLNPGFSFVQSALPFPSSPLSSLSLICLCLFLSNRYVGVSSHFIVQISCW